MTEALNASWSVKCPTRMSTLSETRHAILQDYHRNPSPQKKPLVLSELELLGEAAYDVYKITRDREELQKVRDFLKFTSGILVDVKRD